MHYGQWWFIVLIISTVFTTIVILHISNRTLVKNIYKPPHSSRVITVSLPHNNCPDGTILTVREGGNTGNLIWEYLSVLALSKLYPEKKFIPLVPDAILDGIEKLFQRVSIPSISSIPKVCINYDDAKTVYLNFVTNISQEQSYGQLVVLQKYSCRYQDIFKYGIDKIRTELRFRENDVQSATKTLNRIAKTFSFPRLVAPTFVGVHYRGGDYVHHLLKNYRTNRTIARYDYYNKAMNIFKQKYRYVIFVLISSDIRWVELNKKYLHGNVVVVANKSRSKLDDMTLLSLCNHTIINYGTFGLTAAVLSGGTTVVYDIGVPLDQRGMTVAMGLAKLMDNWILLS